jgi:hypothetical protein
MSNSSPQTRVVEISHEKLRPPFELYSIPVSGFPIPPEEQAVLRDCLDQLIPGIIRTFALSPEVFIQFTELNRGDASDRFSAHGRDWLPSTGLGVWVDRPAPTLWTKEYFLSLKMGEMPRRVMHQLFRVTTTTVKRLEAISVMLGCGTVLACLMREPTELFLDQSKQLLLPRITETCYAHFPYYIPLFELKTLRDALAQQLDEWFCGALVYIRESLEDSAILIASREPLKLVFEHLGAKAIVDAKGVVRWRVSVCDPTTGV